MAEALPGDVSEKQPVPAGPGRGEPLKVAVFSCGDLGVEVARALSALSRVRSVALITAPYVHRRLSLVGRIRQVYRMQGPLGLMMVLAGKLLRPLRNDTEPESILAPSDLLPPSVHYFHFDNFHDPDCLLTLEALQPDLGVIAGTYILRENVFEAPRLGSINLHSGKVPEYRGAAPAFWELYNGEPAVGITIHRVASAVDAGQVLLQESFPLELAPERDPLEYIEEYRRTVLRPNGVRMLVEAVARIAEGTAEETAQDSSRARTYRSPDHRAVRELRRRVRQRRRERRTVET
ncbi:MAG: hypothetical protein H0X65_20530 [Gemmatimonadetes bacterium]|nr:hypothetical protein [Gemmatimonadota bacterium]